MGRFPITHKAWGQSINYWRTGNKLLNEAFYQTKRDTHEWIQSVEHMLCTNGFRNLWMNPRCYDIICFHTAFTKRLNDHYRQSITSSLSLSSRFRTSSTLKDDVHIANYLTYVQNLDIRLIFTRLRLDLNCLASCKTKKNSTHGRIVCLVCNLGTKSVEHFLLNCKIFSWYTTTLLNERQSKYQRLFLF